MAIFVAFAQGSASTTSETDPPCPILAGDVYLLAVMLGNSSSEAAITGFSSILPQRALVNNNNTRWTVLAKRYTADSTDPIIFSAATNGGPMFHTVLRGVPENATWLSGRTEIDHKDGPIHFPRLDASAGGNNQIVLYVVGSTASVRPYISTKDANVILWGEEGRGITVAFKTMPTAGTTPDLTCLMGEGINSGAMFTLCIPDDGTGFVEIDKATPDNEHILFGAGSISKRHLFTDGESLGSFQRFTINNSTGVLTVIDGSNPTNGKLYRIVNTNQTDGFQRVTHYFSVDCSGATCRFSLAPNTSSAMSGTVTGVAATDIWTASGWTPVDDATITSTTTSQGLTAGTTYYIKNTSGSTFQLSTTRNGATTVDCTGTASVTIVPIYASHGVGIRQASFSDANGVTCVASTNVFTFSNYTPVNGDVVMFNQRTGGAGITESTYYYIRDAGISGTGTAKIATSATGSVVDITTDLTACKFAVLQNNTVGSFVTNDSGIDVNIATDVFTAHGFTPAGDGSAISTRGLTGGTGIVGTATYYMVNTAGQTFQLAATIGGAAIDITTNITNVEPWLTLATGVEATNTLTAYGWTPVNGMYINFVLLTGGSGLSTLVLYRVFSVSGQTFKLSGTDVSTDTELNFTTDITRAIIVIINKIKPLSTIVSTIAGIAVHDSLCPFGYASSYFGLGSSSSINGNRLLNFLYDSTFDLTGKLLVIHFVSVSVNLSAKYGTGVVLTDGTNWKAFQVQSISAYRNNETVSFILDPVNGEYIDSSGTVDLSACYLAFYIHRTTGQNNVNVGMGVSNIVAIGKTQIFGGISTRKVQYADLLKCFNLLPAFIRFAGSGQVTLNHSIEIGDGGTHEAHVSGVANDFETPLLFSLRDLTRRLANIGDDVIDVRLNRGANDTVDFSPSLLIGNKRPTFTVASTDNVSAVKNFANAAFFRYGTITNKANEPHTSESYTSGRKILGDAATYTACTVTASTATDAAMQLKSGSSVVACSFTRGAEQYAIEMPDESGDTSITIEDAAFNGYSGANKILHILKTTGTVTVTPVGTTALTAADVDSEGATVVINAPENVTTIASQVSLVGAEVRVYDLDNTPAGSLGTELEGIESCAGATFDFVGTQGNSVWIQVMKPGYEEFGQQLTIPSASSTFTAILIPDSNA